MHIIRVQHGLGWKASIWKLTCACISVVLFHFVERQMIGYEDEMSLHCLGAIPELFDGNPPFKGRGAVSFAMNVAQILRTLNLLEKCDNQ